MERSAGDLCASKKQLDHCVDEFLMVEHTLKIRDLLRTVKDNV